MRGRWERFRALRAQDAVWGGGVAAVPACARPEERQLVGKMRGSGDEREGEGVSERAVGFGMGGVRELGVSARWLGAIIEG